MLTRDEAKLKLFDDIVLRIDKIIATKGTEPAKPSALALAGNHRLNRHIAEPDFYLLIITSVNIVICYFDHG